MSTTFTRFLFPATEHKVTYEKRSLLGRGFLRFWQEAKVERSSNDIHIVTNEDAGRVFINGVEYIPITNVESV